eukprot:CAMPEP_0116121442 /NCGR_PEP_ID=MMETSP0329-20121206/3699_1 /TAXON_ID=697910 /ORGANISM="Pseudo-nitzschia arenysensis, Strain B593" /LENGTH=1015 /DNA_ID=CAMNT_0003615255 /DNA_START=107 /DNA_END=3151 /DNA_ORIENTATION=-
MSDPLSGFEAAEQPHEAQFGLRRRHQARFFNQQRYNEQDEDETDDPSRRRAEVNTENTEINGPRNFGLDFPFRQDRRNNQEDDINTDNRRTRTTDQASQTTNSFSPLSGTIGIGMFRVSRLYCFLSVLSALFAIVLAPIPTHKIQHPDVTAMIHEATEGNALVSQDSPKEERARDFKTTTKIMESMNLIATELKSWSVEEFITHAAFLGGSSSQKGDVDSPEVDDTSDESEKGDKSRKRRRRAPVLEEYRTERRKKTNKVGTSQQEKRSLGHSLSKTRQNTVNEDKSREKDSSTMQGWPKSWIERTTALLEETVADIVHRRKMKFEAIVDEQTDENEDSLDDASTKTGLGGDSKGQNDNSEAAERARNRVVEDWQWVDPIFFEDVSFSFIFTSVVDKILKSTIRLCVITNFLLTMTYLLHSGVAAWFLAHSGASSNAAALQRQHEISMREDRARMGTEWSFASPSGASVARERMGGFLIFKLLLISAVLTPDALDLMILVTWFTLLGCLRSLDHLAHSTNIHLTAMGQCPENGIVQLLCWVLVCDIVAAGSCVALFHTAGYGMVLLLTCDCALLGTDTISHILKYYQSIWDHIHDSDIRALEEEQLNLHRANEQNDESSQGDERTGGHQGEHFSPDTARMTREELREASGRLDLQMEESELAHTRRLAVLDTAIFCLDMTCHVLTVAHFCHIWALHGVQFTLIDGVLALHLHSAISTACAKLARRQNVHKIAQDLEGHFSNATDDELKQAATAGDVCCICLGSMSKGGNVKKAQCGHMYHTHCLREVIERAQSLESAKCPLCRAPLIDDCHSSGRNNRSDNRNFFRQSNQSDDPRIPTAPTANHTVDSRAEGDGGENIAPVRPAEGEEALFRFSTEEILPAWIPLPAFSFEVVRRPQNETQRAGHLQDQQLQTGAAPTQRIDPVDILASNQDDANTFVRQAEQVQEEEVVPMPFFQRILQLTGLLPMTPEEESQAIAQLVDIFPQYDRNDLLQELRYRGSLEAVTEAMLMGIVPG